MKIDMEGKRKLKASLANIALFLSIFVVIFPLTMPNVSAAPKTWYVDEGEDIQPVIIAASAGDTIHVNSSTHYEKINIFKTLTLEGNGSDSTIIQPPPGSPGTVITISASWVNVTGFTIKNGGSNAWKGGIRINNYTHINITDNKIENNGQNGIIIEEGSYNEIYNNQIQSNEKRGVFIYGSSNNTIRDNVISNHPVGDHTFAGITLATYDGDPQDWSTGNVIDFNTLTSNNYGVLLWRRVNNTIIDNNNIYNSSEYGIGTISDSTGIKKDNKITNNTIYNTEDKAKAGIYLEDFNDSYIYNNTINDTEIGVHLSNSNNNTIDDNDVFDNTNYGIYLNGSLGSHLNIISYNTVYENEEGISLSDSCENKIENNTIINNNENGIYLNTECTNNTIYNNEIQNNSEKGIYLYKSSGYNTIKSNNISHNSYGLFIDPAIYSPYTCTAYPNDYNKIEFNNFTYNDYDGIYLRYSRWNSISHNNISHNGYINVSFEDHGNGIFVAYGSSNNYIDNNTLINNSRAGIHLSEIEENHKEVIKHILKDIYNVTFFNNTINIATYGISLGYTDYDYNGSKHTYTSTPINDITFNETNLYNVSYGIYIGNGYDNYFYNTKIENQNQLVYGLYVNRDIETNYQNSIPKNNTVNGEALYLYYNEHYSSETPLLFDDIETLILENVSNIGKISIYNSSYIIVSNKTISNGTIGIFLHSANNITVHNNTIFNMSEVGLHVENGYWHNITLNNTFDGEIIHYYTNQTNITIENKSLDTWNVSNVGKITLAYSNNILLKNNNVSNNDYGIFLYGSKDVSMWNNNMSLPKLAGLFVEDGFHHNISQNNTANNKSIYYFSDINGSENNPIVIDYYNLTNSSNAKLSNVGLITFVNSSYIEIRNNTVQSNYGSGIFIVDSFNITAENNTAQYNCDGIVLRSSKNVTITKNKFNLNTKTIGYGIQSGIHLMYTNAQNLNYITNNTEIENNTYGIYVDYSENDVITNHNQTILNNRHGIYLDHSTPHIYNNYFSHNSYIIRGEYSHPIIEWNTFNQNPENPGHYGGYAIYFFNNCNRSAKIINNTFEWFKTAAIYLLNAASPEIINNEIKNIESDGITVYHGDSAPYIYNNTIYNTGLMGIQLEDANATIIQNRIHDVSEGINVASNPNVAPCLKPSTRSNATIVNNTIWNANRYGSASSRNAGIDFAGYSVGVILNNTIYNCTNISGGRGYGIYVHGEATPSVISGNNCSYNDYGIVILDSQENLTVNNNTAIGNNLEGISIQEAASTLVAEGNNVSYNYYGFSLYDSLSQIKNNKVLLNEYGIYIGSGSPTISHNVIEHNGNGTYIFGSASPIINTNYISYSEFYGIYIQNTTGSLIYHNNMINNTYQAYDNTNNSNLWDNGYPSGGNYWSDYNGTDNYKGPGQNISGSDGIGDTNYTIDADSQDNYPLMDPWGLVLNVNKNLWYFSISEAISEADSGNALEAMMGTYQEKVVVNKTLNITGKYGTTRTIIDGGGNGDVIYITGNWVNITGFTVTESGSNMYDAGVEIDNAQNCSITNNNISNNDHGVNVNKSFNVIIISNTILFNNYGILTDNSSSVIQYNDISYNYIEGIGNLLYSNTYIGNNTIIHNNITGIAETHYSNATIDNNTISHSYLGIGIGESSPIITYNNITNNIIGIECVLGSNATVHWNNIHNNTQWNISNWDNTIWINATNNYWGGVPPNGINGQVIYVPYLSVPVEDAGPQ
jgi:parallel beta-helix repeat protein